jgi:hypothetical protein
MRKFFLCVYGLLSATFSVSQPEVLKYARYIVDTLASPAMHGRGYVNKGDSIAAAFIKKEFEKNKLKSFGEKYCQRFSFPVNTFPGNISLKINGQNLIPGKDFLPASYCASCNGKTKCLITEPDKLTHEISNKEGSSCCFIVLKSSLPQKTKKASCMVQNKFIPSYESQNVIGYIEGLQQPDSFVVFTAHYDHLGMIGSDVYFPGANDNASGCAMLLSLAKYYSINPPKYSMAFMAFGAEEIGLLGSKHYVENPFFNLMKIKFLVNFDIVGTGDEGIKVVNATEHKTEFDLLVRINSEKKYLPSVLPRGKAAISDHHFFEEAGVKTFYIYTLGGIGAYHDIYDRPETLPLTAFGDLYKLMIDFTTHLQN